jgi:threonine/homoserine/homoserine lactone efflux protein
MMDTAKLFVFLTAAFLLAIAPGPGMLYVLARSLAGGKREGALSALGTFVGGMVHVFVAAAGVSVILARSAAAFAAVKYAGAAYLCFLGIRMILEAYRDTAQSTSEVSIYTTLPRRGPFWQGVTTEVLNPKTALFFLSFIPQFVDRQNGHIFLQFLILGSVSVVMNTLADLIVTALAGPLGNRIRSSATFRRRQRTATGVIMVGLGTYLATRRNELLQRNDLMIQAVCAKGVVEIAQKLRSLARCKVQAANLPLLQDLVGIECVGQ